MKNVIQFGEAVPVPELELEQPWSSAKTWKLCPRWHSENSFRMEGIERMSPMVPASHGSRDAQLWAERVIPLTTSFRVSGWSDDGLTPELVEVQHAVDLSFGPYNRGFRMADAFSKHKIQDALRGLKMLEFDDGQSVTMIPAQAVIRAVIVTVDA